MVVYYRIVNAYRLTFDDVNVFDSTKKVKGNIINLGNFPIDSQRKILYNAYASKDELLTFPLYQIFLKIHFSAVTFFEARLTVSESCFKCLSSNCPVVKGKQCKQKKFK